MSHSVYHRPPLPPVQDIDLSDEAWKETVATRLPADLQAQAQGLKAWTRKRGLQNVSDLLRALLVYAACDYSFRELGIWAVLKGIGSLSERAWRKRFQQSRVWIAWLLMTLLSSGQSPAWLPADEERILIVDATRWKTPGGTGDDVRLHQSYDLHTGRMHQVQITDRHQAESLRHFDFQEADLVVTDAGYPLASGVEETQVRQASLLQRISVFLVRLETEAGKVIKLKEQVQGQEADSVRELAAWITLPTSGKREQVRVLCYRLPEEQAKKARARKEAHLRKKHGKNYNKERVWWAGWVLLVTTAKAERWSASDLMRLYRARWQIELFFKRIKQCLSWHSIEFSDLQRATTLVQLKLIAWWVQEQEAQWMRELLQGVLMAPAGKMSEVPGEPDEDDKEQERQGVWSGWTLAHVGCDEVQAMLRGVWSRQRKEQCNAHLVRYVHSCKRGHRESEQRDWLCQRRSLPPHGSAA